MLFYPDLTFYVNIFQKWKSICDKVCQWPATGWWFSPGTPTSSTNKTDPHDITEILLKVALSTITPGNENLAYYCIFKESHWKQESYVLLLPSILLYVKIGSVDPVVAL